MRKGSLEVVCGPMFSGKTEELIRRVRRAMIAGLKVQVFKPIIDNRYIEGEVCTHDGLSVEAQPVTNAEEIFKLGRVDVDVVAVDEAQFFDYEIVQVCRKLVRVGVRVIVAGLDMDFRGEPFGEAMPELLAIAGQVTKLTAVCDVCKQFNAAYTQRLIDGQPAPFNSPIVQVGGKEAYQARCASCHEVPGRPWW